MTLMPGMGFFVSGCLGLYVLLFEWVDGVFEAYILYLAR